MLVTCEYVIFVTAVLSGESLFGLFPVFSCRLTAEYETVRPAELLNEC